MVHTIPAGEISVPLSLADEVRISHSPNNQVIVHTGKNEDEQFAMRDTLREKFPHAHIRPRRFPRGRQVRLDKEPRHRLFEIPNPEMVTDLTYLNELCRSFFSSFASRYSIFFIQEKHWHQYADRFESGNGQLGLAAELLLQVTVRLFAERLQIYSGIEACLCSEEDHGCVDSIQNILREEFVCCMNGHNAEFERNGQEREKGVHEFDAVLRVSVDIADTLHLFFDVTTTGRAQELSDKSKKVTNFRQELVEEDALSRVGALVLSHRPRMPGSGDQIRLNTMTVAPLRIVKKIVEATKCTLSEGGNFSEFQITLEKLIQETLYRRRKSA